MPSDNSHFNLRAAKKERGTPGGQQPPSDQALDTVF